MSSQEDKYRNYYEALELEENATLADINRAYKKLKELYSTESIVTDPILDEFGEDQREEIVDQIEEAYKALVLYVVQKDRAQKLPGEEEQKPEDTTEEEEEKVAIPAELPEPAKEIREISDVIAETKEEIDEIEEEEEVLLLDEVLPDEESIKTMIAPPTAAFPTSASASPARPAASAPSASPAPPVPPEEEQEEIPMELAKAKTPVESLEPLVPLVPLEPLEPMETLEPMEPMEPPPDFPEELEPDPHAATIHIHENDQDHEPIHIELPDKDDDLQDNEFEILGSDEEEEEEEEPVIENLEEKYKIPARKGIWDESLFEKDIDSIKKEITKDLTKDIQEQLTFTREPSEKAGESQVINQAEGISIKGRTLRKLREKLGMGIHEMAVSTKIHYKILVNIEKERFAKLPEPGYLRWYLMTYAKRLSLDPKRVADEYMKRYRQWEKEQKSLA